MNWQPIDTAPKDGTPILGFDARYSKTKVHERHTAASHDSEDERWSPFEVICWVKHIHTQWIMSGPDIKRRQEVDWSGWERSQGSYYPTHWMPLPEPPIDSNNIA